MYIFNFFNKLNETIKDKDEEKKWRKNYLSVGKLGNHRIPKIKRYRCQIRKWCYCKASILSRL